MIERARARLARRRVPYHCQRHVLSIRAENSSTGAENSGAPPPQQDDVPRGGTRPRGRGSSKFAHGREASSDKLIRWKFAPLEPDWASKVELGADAVETIRPTERLVEFWLRVSRPMAEALDQKFEVLNERDAPADNISPLLDAVAGKRKAGAVAAAPGAKRSRGGAAAVTA